MSSRDHRFPPSDSSTTVPSTSSGGHAVNRQADFAPEFVVEAKPFRWFHALVLAALGVGLLWLVVTKSFAAYLADVAPEWALKLNPNEPNALLRLADQKLMLIRAAEANAKKIGQFAVAAPAIGNSAKAGSVLQPAGKETSTALASDAQTGSPEALAAAQRKTLDEIRKLVERADRKSVV